MNSIHIQPSASGTGVCMCICVCICVCVGGSGAAMLVRASSLSLQMILETNLMWSLRASLISSLYFQISAYSEDTRANLSHSAALLHRNHLLWTSLHVCECESREESVRVERVHDSVGLCDCAHMTVSSFECL